MTPIVRSFIRRSRRVWRDRRGVSSLIFAVSLATLLGMAAISVDVGVALSARAALQANTNAAVLSAAQAWSDTEGTEATASNAALSWYRSNPVPLTSSVTPSTPTFFCVTSTAGLPDCSGTAPNVIELTQTARVPTYFARIFGVNSVTVVAKAAAARAGGPSKPLNIMFVLDTTQSMGTTTDDSGCTVPGIKTPSRLNCALYGIQLVLKQLNPAVDEVGLMVFPGMKTQWAPTATSCSSSPAVEPYGTSGIVYQVIHNALDSNYASAIGTLNDTSLLVRTVGDNAAGRTGCLYAPGGEGTYYAEALADAQTALLSEGSASAQNVIILLSDGAATATASQMASSYASSACSPNSGEPETIKFTEVCANHTLQDCNQAVYNAQLAATAAPGTWVYSIAYDSPTTDCPSGTKTTGSGSHKTTTTVYDSPTGGTINQWTPCSTMQNIASNLSFFFSTDSACQDGPNTYTNVATAFQQAGTSLSAPRLVMAQ